MTSERPTSAGPTFGSEGGGSTRDVGAAGDAPATESEPPPSTTRVLYVDPADPPSALSAADDVSLSAVPTGEAALDRLASSGGVDCVVSEYDLPETDGLGLLDAVREEYPDFPFVLYTDSGSETLASEALGRGVTDYLPKDVAGERLRERVDRAVATAAVPAESGVSVERLRKLTDAFPHVVFLLDETGRYLAVLSRSGTETPETAERGQLVGKRLHDVFSDARADRFLDHVRETLDAGGVETMEYRLETDGDDRWFEVRTVPLGDAVDGREAVVWVARDVTGRRRGERELAAQQDELARLNRINDLIHNILQSLVGSASREEIERIVCEGLANSEFYRFAWVGGPWVKDERTNPSVVEGADPDEIERLVQATSTRAGDENSFARVVSEDESVVVSDVAEADVLSERECDIMLDLGMSSAVLVPLSHGSTNYGVLGVSGACAGTFGERELTALETLGEIVSFAINGVRNRNLLLSDTAVELEFRVDSHRSAFARLSSELDARFELEGVVPVSDDRVLEYVAVDGASAETVARRLGELDATEERRVVSDEDDGGLLELDLARSGVDQLLTAGAVVTSAVAEAGTVRYVAEASADANVRSIVDSFRTTYPDAELASKQEVDRPVYTATEFRGTLDRDLTDKQRTALQTAYFAGYYEYPRESTGEQVADSLGISSPTLHQHLQAAQRKLIGTYFER